MRIQGHLEVANRRRVKGWAQDRDSPDTPVSLVITVNGGFVARVIANKFRNDLQKVDGQGRLAFEFEFTECLSPLERVVIDVRSELDGTQLPRSPRAIERSSDFNPQMRQAVSDLLLSFHTDAEAEDRLGFLAEQTQAVLRTRQETRGGPNARQARRRLRWRNGLATEEAPPEKPRALFINDKLPVTVSDAGSNAVVSHMRSLARCGYEVNLIAANFSQERPAADLGEFIRLAWPWYCSVEDVLACHRNSFDIVYLHRINTASIYTTLVRHYQPTAHIIFSVADLSSLRLRRQAEREQRPELLTLVRQLAEQELRACQDADAIITHSSFEAALLRRSLRNDKVRLVPFGVASQPTRTPFASRAGLAFIGGYSHSPNVDAAIWLAERIMPEVGALNPAIQCLLVGSAMPDHLRALASATILPIGAMQDLSVLFGSVRLTVAPLTFGAGVKGKVLESLASGIPCVCTPIAAEGLDLPEPLNQLVASDPASLAALILRLHEDEAFNATCSEAGLSYIAKRNSPDAVDSAMRDALRIGRLSYLPPATSTIPVPLETAGTKS